MKKYLAIMMVLCGLLISANAWAVPLSITPATTPQWTGNDTSQKDINDAIASILSVTAKELYKSNVGGVEEGALALSYETEFTASPTKPSGAIINYFGGDYINDPQYLLVKDGRSEPAWYLFDLTNLWNGKDKLVLSGFWLNEYDEGRISHVTLYGKQATQVPEPATLILLGLGLLGIAGFRRKK